MTEQETSVLDLQGYSVVEDAYHAGDFDDLTERQREILEPPNARSRRRLNTGTSSRQG